MKPRCGEITGMLLAPPLVLLYATALCFARQRAGAYQTSLRRARAMMAQRVHKVSSRRKPLIAATAKMLLRSLCAACLPVSRWRLSKLALLTFVLRACLTTVIVWSTWQLIALCLPLGGIRWGILIPATAAAATVLFGGMLDLEAAAAERAARTAKFMADRWGARAETVRIHAQEYVRTHGHCPQGMHMLTDIYTGTSFTVVYGSTE
jgi:hypothetical protein